MFVWPDSHLLLFFSTVLLHADCQDLSLFTPNLWYFVNISPLITAWQNPSSFYDKSTWLALNQSKISGENCGSEHLFQYLIVSPPHACTFVEWLCSQIQSLLLWANSLLTTRCPYLSHQKDNSTPINDPLIPLFSCYTRGQHGPKPITFKKQIQLSSFLCPLPAKFEFKRFDLLMRVSHHWTQTKFNR